MHVHATFSAEAKIRHGLDLLNCAPSNFCVMAGVCGRTKFFEVMNGVGNRRFTDEEAEALLFFLEQLWDLQSVVDEASRDERGRTTHVPLDFSQHNKIKTALTVRLAQKCLDAGDHALDESAARTVNALRREPLKEVVR